MVEVVTRIDPITKREKVMEKGFEDFPKVVRVEPRDDRIRKYIKHAITKVGFPKEGSCEWPNDQFTRNRIREGVISIEEKQEKQEAAPRGALRTGAKPAADAPKT